MTYEVLIMPSAEAELEAAYLWIAERDPDAAVKWYNGVLDAFLTLETFPERCPLAPERDAFDTRSVNCSTAIAVTPTESCSMWKAGMFGFSTSGTGREST